MEVQTYNPAMHRRNVLLGSLGCLLPSSNPGNAQQKSDAGGRLKDYPALRRYLASLKSIPKGTFQMGSASGPSDERPKHTVRLSAFRMAATPVTVAVWKEYCAATGTPRPDAPPWGLLDDHPVVYVSWNDIMGTDGKGGFCAWASDVAGFRLTLPTEAQFEYASRGGQDGNEFPWGNTFDRRKVWCSLKALGDAGKTAPVVRTSKIFRNAYGLTDMSGNVYQWCSDLVAPDTSDAQADRTRLVSGASNKRCVRGSSWLSIIRDDFRCAIRGSYLPDFRFDVTGFRLVAG